MARMTKVVKRSPDPAQAAAAAVPDDPFPLAATLVPGGRQFQRLRPFNANHPITRRMILDSLRYWVSEMHVDGFRFDLAAILSRDSDGRVLANAPVLWDIESEPVLAGTKLIAEAWDAAGLYQVGTFVGDSWKEWNGKFRDDARSFMRGDKDSVS